MKRLIVSAFAAAVLAGCASESMRMTLPDPEGLPREREPSPMPSPRAGSDRLNVKDLQARLGMNRSADELGFADSGFDSCRLGVREDGASCGRRYLSVVHFRLVCRDSVGTTTRVPSSLTPLSRSMEWRLGGSRGYISTDSQGYGQVRVVSNRQVKSDRFMLIIGTKTLGLEAGEVSQIVLPGNWCGRLAMN